MERVIFISVFKSKTMFHLEEGHFDAISPFLLPEELSQLTALLHVKQHVRCALTTLTPSACTDITSDLTTKGILNMRRT